VDLWLKAFTAAIMGGIGIFQELWSATAPGYSGNARCRLYLFAWKTCLCSSFHFASHVPAHRAPGGTHRGESL